MNKIDCVTKISCCYGYSNMYTSLHTVHIVYRPQFSEYREYLCVTGHSDGLEHKDFQLILE